MIGNISRRIVVAGIVVLALPIAVGACSKKAEPSSAPPATTTTTTPPPTSKAPAGTVVQQVDFAFDPSDVAATEGETITVENTTSGTLHTFTVDGEDIDVTVDPGTSEEITLDLAPGTYAFECRFHASSGMEGTLEVT